MKMKIEMIKKLTSNESLNLKRKWERYKNEIEMNMKPNWNENEMRINKK